MNPLEPNQPSTEDVTISVDDRPDRRYAIFVRGAPFRMVIVYAHAESPAGRWRNPRVRSEETTLEFKHRGPNGNTWTSAPGVRHALRLPNEAITFLRERTYSYPKILVAGVEIVTSTSGGSAPRGPNGQDRGWEDFVFETIGTLVVRDTLWLEALARVALELGGGL